MLGTFDQFFTISCFHPSYNLLQVNLSDQMVMLEAKSILFLTLLEKGITPMAEFAHAMGPLMFCM